MSWANVLMTRIGTRVTLPRSSGISTCSLPLSNEQRSEMPSGTTVGGSYKILYLGPFYEAYSLAYI